jgi:prolyl-tRNA editing enzyme YbaK/EbsC (Cys-tRNA(Pro) deacylase)
MHQRAQEFTEKARERHGFEADAHEFPAGTKTAADAAEAIGCDVSQIASSLMFVADGDPVVVVTSGANRASEEKVGSVVGAADVRMAEPEEVKAATGWSIGGVPPFCHDDDLRVLFDETLADHETVWAAAGTPEAVFPIDPDRLVDIADAEPADVAE